MRIPNTDLMVQLLRPSVLGAVILVSQILGSENLEVPKVAFHSLSSKRHIFGLEMGRIEAPAINFINFGAFPLSINTNELHPGKLTAGTQSHGGSVQMIFLFNYLLVLILRVV